MSRNFNGSTDELFLAAGGMAGCTHGTFAAIFRVDDTANFRTVMAFVASGGSFIATPLQINDTDQMTWNGNAFGSAIPQNTWLCVVVRKPTGTALARMSYYRYDTGAWVHTPSGATEANFTALGGTDLITPATNTSGAEGFDGDLALWAAWENHLPWAADAIGDASLEQSGLQWDLLAWLNSYGHKQSPVFASAGAGAITEASGGALSPASPATVDAGDLLTIFAYYEGVATAPSTPSGFTLLDGPRTLASNVGRCWVFGKKADGTEDGASNALGTPAVTTMRAARCYRFTGVLDDTVANIVGGFGFNGPASSATVTDQAVTTPEAACLAVNLLTVADDNAVGNFTGETGGDWTEAIAEFTSAATTPDYCQQLQTAAIGAAGTIDGGSLTMAAADPWGVVGFYIRPAAGGVAANPPTMLALFDQSAVAQTVIDLTGNGSNEAAGRVGTTVGTSEPPGFGYGADPIASPGHGAGVPAVAFAPGSLTLEAVAGDPEPGPVTVVFAVTQLTLEAVAGTPVPGPVTVAYAPGQLTVEAVAGTPVPSVAFAPGELTLIAVAGSPVPQPVTVPFVPTQLTLEAIAGDPEPQPVTVVWAPVQLTLEAVAGTPVPGPVTVAYMPGTLTLEAGTFSGGAGAPTVAFTPGELTLQAIAGVPVPGPVTALWAPSDLTLHAVAGVPVPGPVTVPYAPGQLTLEAVPHLTSLTVPFVPGELTLQAVAGFPTLHVAFTPGELTLVVGSLVVIPPEGFHTPPERVLRVRETRRLRFYRSGREVIAVPDRKLTIQP